MFHNMPAFTYTLGDARNSAIRKVAGVCANGDDFRDYINEATQRLTNIGTWFDTDQVARFCYEGCNVVFPRWVRTVNGARFCTNGEAPIHNSWWSVIGPKSCYPGFAGFDWGVGVRDSGMVPCYNEISGTTGKSVAYHITRPEDVGKTITIFGTQFGGMPLAENRNGVWSQGITIAAKAAGGTTLPAMTSVLVTKITSVIRDATAGPVWLYEYGQGSTGAYGLRDLANYAPSEIRPRYRQMKIDGICGEIARTDDYGRKIRSLDAICKLQFIPVESDEDFLLVSNFQALKLAVQALILEEAGNTQDAELKWLSSTREMNRDDRMQSPGSQISVNVDVSGTRGRCLVNPV